MQRTAAGGWRTTYGIGLGCGLVAGLLGVAQWVMAQQYLAAQQAAFQAEQQYANLHDATNLVRGYQWFYFITAPFAAAIAFFVCLLAAYAACWFSPRQRDGVVAAWVAAILGGSIWGMATFVVTITNPEDPAMIASLFPCESLLGLLAFSMLAALAPVAAWMGQLSSPGRYA